MTEKRAHLIEITRYSKPWNDSWLSEYDGVIQRAGSQGGKDNRWDEFHQNVMRFPVRGAYWYFGSAVGWRVQADAFLKIVGNDFHFLACDFESYGNTLSRAFVASAMEFCAYLKSKGHKVILYTNQSTYQDWLARYDAARAAQYPFWFSWPLPQAFIGVEDVYLPLVPKSRTDWTFWQYAFGEHDALTGCEKDVFNGTVAELRTWAGVDGQPPQPVTLEDRVAAIERRINAAGIPQ